MPEGVAMDVEVLGVNWPPEPPALLKHTRTTRFDALEVEPRLDVIESGELAAYPGSAGPACTIAGVAPATAQHASQIASVSRARI
jgi:hypothetical protein